MIAVMTLKKLPERVFIFHDKAFPFVACDASQLRCSSSTSH